MRIRFFNLSTHTATVSGSASDIMVENTPTTQGPKSPMAKPTEATNEQEMNFTPGNELFLPSAFKRNKVKG